MTTHPTHAEPFWQVQSVFDPDGTGGDFAYTIGLHTRGLPELHLWARPSLGEDPGEDWMLSPRDRCGVLNELAGNRDPSCARARAVPRHVQSARIL